MNFDLDTQEEILSTEDLYAGEILDALKAKYDCTDEASLLLM